MAATIKETNFSVEQPFTEAPALSCPAAIRNTFLPIALIVSICVIVFLTKVKGQFLADDFYFNMKGETFAFSLKNIFDLGFFWRSAYFYRPVPLALWVLLYKLVGPSPAYFHALLLALHSINGILLFLLVRKLSTNNVALLSACVFSVFTGHIEALQWLSGIFDVLSTQFFLFSLLMLIQFLQKTKIRFLLFSLIFGAVSVLAKENAVALPSVVLLVSLIWFSREKAILKSVLSSIMLSIPFGTLYICYFFFRTQILQNYGVATPEGVSVLQAGVLQKYLLVFSSLVAPNDSLQAVRAILPYIILLFFLAILICFYRKKDSRGLICLGFFWILLTGTSAVVIADRYSYTELVTRRLLYLPAAGFSMILAQILMVFSQSFQRKHLRPLLPCIAVFLYSINTIYHNQDWLEAWRISKQIQKQFKADVQPLLGQPAKVYFYDVPEYVNKAPVFSVGLAECFAQLANGEKYRFHAALEGFSPHLQSAEDIIIETDVPEYLLLRWNEQLEHFQTLEPPFSFLRTDKAALTWEFPSRQSNLQWTPAHDIALLYERTSRSYKYVTTGEFSFLKSPPLANMNIRYLRITCQVRHPSGQPLSGRLFWATEKDTDYNVKKSILFPVRNDTLMHTYTIPLDASGWFLRDPHIIRMAIRLSDYPATEVNIKSISLYPY